MRIDGIYSFRFISLPCISWRRARRRTWCTRQNLQWSPIPPPLTRRGPTVAPDADAWGGAILGLHGHAERDGGRFDAHRGDGGSTGGRRSACCLCCLAHLAVGRSGVGAGDFRTLTLATLENSSVCCNRIFDAGPPPTSVGIRSCKSIGGLLRGFIRVGQNPGDCRGGRVAASYSGDLKTCNKKHC